MYKPRTPQEFYCSFCDKAKVNSEKPETGTFYLCAGHAFNQKTKEYDGEYVQVMYALCRGCDK